MSLELKKEKVIFICTRNSSRSQMAEGILRSLYGDYYESFSAGTEPGAVNPNTIQVMKEIGIDISGTSSDGIDKYLGMRFDYVVTVCDHAKETCPVFPGGDKYLHNSFKDPHPIEGEEDKALDCFREVRDQIKNWIEQTFEKRSREIIDSVISIDEQK